VRIKKSGGIMLFLKPGQMDEAVKWFTDVMGAKLGPPLDHLARFGFRARAVWVGDEDPFRIEISEPLPDKIATGEHLEVAMGRQIMKSAPCYGDLGFVVEDLDEAIAELRAKGVTIGDKLKIDDPRFEELYEAMIHPKSAFGVIIELIEYKKLKQDMY